MPKDTLIAGVDEIPEDNPEVVADEAVNNEEVVAPDPLEDLLVETLTKESELIQDLLVAVVVALRATRSSGAFTVSKNLIEKYATEGGLDPEDFTETYVTTKSLNSA